MNKTIRHVSPVLSAKMSGKMPYSSMQSQTRQAQSENHGFASVFNAAMANVNLQRKK
jgi:hypothetical protein